MLNKLTGRDVGLLVMIFIMLCITSSLLVANSNLVIQVKKLEFEVNGLKAERDVAWLAILSGDEEPKETVVPARPRDAFDDRIPSDEEMLALESGENDPGELSDEGFQALPPRDSWMAEFRKTRRGVIKIRPCCEACGRRPPEVNQLDMHHKVSVKRIVEEKLDRKLLSDSDNMVMLCRDDHGGCHLKFGHTVNGEPNFKHSNPHVERDVRRAFAKSHPGWTYEEFVESVVIPSMKPEKSQTAKTVLAP